MTARIRPHISLFLLLCTVLIRSYVDAQWIGDSVNETRIHRGIGYVYDLSFDKAKQEFEGVVRARPEHPAGHFFLAMVEWWRIVTDLNNTSHDDHFLSLLDQVIDLCDKRLDRNENDVAALFFKGGALGFQGRLYGNREDWVKAANSGREALPIVQKAYRLDPNNDDVLLGIGIYNYYAAVVPVQYPFVKPFMVFFPKGDKEKGLEQLQQASEKARYANYEAMYFRLQVLQNFEKRYDEAAQIASALHAEFPNNVIFHRYVGRCAATLGKWEELRSTYREVLQRVKEHRTGYDAVTEREANYYLGLDEMNSGHYDAALTFFYRADELSRTLDVNEFSGYMAMANLKIGMIYDLQGKRALAVAQYQKVLKMKNYQDAHKTAEQYIATPYQKS